LTLALSSQLHHAKKSLGKDSSLKSTQSQCQELAAILITLNLVAVDAKILHTLAKLATAKLTKICTQFQLFMGKKKLL
jgi:hypothetical protein